MKTLDLAPGRIHFIDEGAGTPIVFVHGTPSSSEEFSDVIRELSSRYRCLAPDLLGFGRSDRPQDWSYSLEAHAETFRQWVEAVGLNDFHLVVHDFGGSVALPFAIEQPQRIRSLTILNSWFWPLEEVDPKFARDKRWIDTWLMKFLYLKMNFSARMMVRMSWGTHRPLDRSRHRKFMDLFPDAGSRIGTWAFARAVANPGAFYHHYELSRLRPVRTQLIWGMGDRFIHAAHLGHWRRTLPQAEVVEVPKAGHFLQAEAPEIVSRAIADFLKRDAK